jgi:hypothetical protein
MAEGTGYRHRYRLPASLGGGEYEGIVNGGHVLLDVPGVGAVPFEAAVVTKIVPEEPEDGSFVVVVRDASRGEQPWVFSRHDDPVGETPNAAHWWWHDEGRWVPWLDVYVLSEPRVLHYSGLLTRTAGARGYCSYCKTTVPMRVDGKLKLHGSKYNRCAGSQRLPGQGA